MAVAATVAHPPAAAARRTGQRPNAERGHRHTPPIHTEAVVAAARALRREAGIDIFKTEVDEGGAAGDDLTARVDEGVGEDGHRLHAELEPLVKVGAVEHAAADVLLAAGDVGLVEAVVAAVSVAAALAVLLVALVVRLLARGAPQQAALYRENTFMKL